jgi:hypothetical protein
MVPVGVYLDGKNVLGFYLFTPLTSLDVWDKLLSQWIQHYPRSKGWDEFLEMGGGVPSSEQSRWSTGRGLQGAKLLSHRILSSSFRFWESASSLAILASSIRSSSSLSRIDQGLWGREKCSKPQVNANPFQSPFDITRSKSGG